jgi:transposase
MTRTEQSLPEITGEQRVAVEAVLRLRDLAPRVRERLEMVKAVARGQDLASIGRWTGRSPRTVRRGVGRFVAGGIPALADAPRPGRPAVADAS